MIRLLLFCLFNLDQLPHLFLSDAELEELKGNVVVRPRWLITLMKKIMALNLKSNCDGVNKSLVLQLKLTGEADLILLEQCWKDILDDQNVMTLRQLCLLLKAYCLIFPLNKKRGNGTEVQSESEKAERNDSDSENNEDLNGTNEAFNYFLVPSMLPEKFPEEVREKIPKNLWLTFYFDFEGFLPAEVYHRLLCNFLIKTKSEYENFFSRNECILDSPEKTWRIVWKEFEHLLEVSVVG